MTDHFESRCSCPDHAKWGYDGVPHLKLFLVRGTAEEQYCRVRKFGKHKSRKRKICQLCRDRIVLEKKCKLFEVRSGFSSVVSFLFLFISVYLFAIYKKARILHVLLYTQMRDLQYLDISGNKKFNLLHIVKLCSCDLGNLVCLFDQSP